MLAATPLPKLQGARITLRAMQAVDITDTHVGWLNDPEVVRHSNQRFVHHTPASSLRYLHSFEGSANLYASVRLHDSDRAIGTLQHRVPRSHRPPAGPASRPARGAREGSVDYAASMKPVDVVGVRVEMPSNNPIVLLRQVDTDRYVPIWVGANEATAIAYAQQGVVPPRPLTHDLMRDVLGALKVELERVEVTDLDDGVFYAQLVLSSGVTVAARPSDAIALALRTGSPVFVADEVLEEAGVHIPDEAGDEAEDEVEKFREFLDQISPEDFGAGS